MKKISYADLVKKFVKKSKPFRSNIPKEKEDALIIEKLPGYFLIFAILGTLFYMFQILRPFIAVIFLAAVLTVAFYPVYHWIFDKFNMKRLASLVTCLIVVLVIIAPISFFILMLSAETIDTYQIVRAKVESGVFDQYLQWEPGGILYDFKQQIDPFVDIQEIDLKESIISGAQGFSTFVFDQTTSLLKGLGGLVMNFIIMLFTMYYFFKDGEDLVGRLGFLSPLPSVYEGELFRKMNSMVKAIVFGVFFTAIVQGLVGGIGYAIVGISNPVFWGTFIAFFSLVPVVGTAAVWGPTVIILAILGDYWQAIFIMVWGMGVIGTVDNFLRPYLIGGKANTYPLATFFVILGGIWTMGLKGIIVGPLILMVLLSLLHIYEAEYRKVLKN